MKIMKKSSKQFAFVGVNFNKIGQEMTSVYRFLFEKLSFYEKYIGKNRRRERIMPTYRSSVSLLVKTDTK